MKEKIYTYIGDMHVDHFTSKNTMNFNSEIDFEYRLSLLLLHQSTYLAIHLVNRTFEIQIRFEVHRDTETQ